MKKFFNTVAIAVCSAAVFCGCEDQKSSASESAEAKTPAAVNPVTKAQQLTQQVTNRTVQPVVQGRQRGRQINAVNELKQLGLGLMMYMDDNNRMPDSIGQLSSYCSGVDLKPYAYVGGNLGKVPGNTPVIFVKPQYISNDTVAVLYADGHVENKKIYGISKMSCKKAAERITADVKDKNLRNKIVKNAEKIK